MPMAERIRRIERTLAAVEGAGLQSESDELRRLFNEYAGEIRSLEERATLGVVLTENTAGHVRTSEILDRFQPFVERLVSSDVARNNAIIKTEKSKTLLFSKVNSLHILVTVILAFGIVYALLGFPMPRITDVVAS